MSTKSFVLDYGLPGLAALGVGLVSYMLTGGPEEYPEPNVEVEEPSMERGTEYDDDEDQRHNATSSTGIPDAPPLWAVQLVEQNKVMAEELRLLKEAAQHQTEQHSLQFRQLQAQYQSSAAKAVCEECKNKRTTEDPTEVKSDTETSLKSAEVDAPVERDWMLLARLAVWNMANPTDTLAPSTTKEALLSSVERCASQATQDKQAESVDKTESNSFAAACDMLLMYINNIVKNPTVPRYRRVSTTNNSYMKSLSAVQGHEAFLSAVGFARKAESNHFEYEWHSLPTATADSASVDNKNVTDKPRSAQEATALLTEATVLLTALKTSVGQLATVLQERLTAVAAPADSPTSGEASSSGNDTNNHTTLNSSAVSSSTPLTLGGAALNLLDSTGTDDNLISVVEVSEHEGMTGGGEAAAAVDFMQILKKAQESKGKSTT